MTFKLRVFAVLTALCAALVAPAFAQQAEIAFGGLAQDTTLPVETKAETFSINSADGTAIFSGNVLVAQGNLRLSAAQVRVEYDQDGKGIARLHASGGVTVANASDAAEAREAVYTIADGAIVMTGDVLLTQGNTALSGAKLTIQLKNGTGRMEGGVSTVFVPSKKN